MSTFKTLATSTPYGDTDEVLHLYLDVESDAYVLKNVIKLVGSYTFSIWHRSEITSNITFNLFGNTEEVSSTKEWQKYIKTVDVANLEDPNIYIISKKYINTYLYEGFLSEGVLDNSWTPAPEDSDRNFTQVRSEIKIAKDEVLTQVSANDGRLSQFAVDLNGVRANIETLDGHYGRLEAKANSIEAEVGDARGNSSSLAIRIGEIESKVVDENGQSIIEQTSQQIAMSVVENKFKDFKASARNLIRNSKTLLYNKYYLTINGNSVFVDEYGTLITNSAIDTDDSGALIFVTPPTVDSDGVLII